MANKLVGEGVYQGKHWMQDPKNKAKVMAMVNKMHRGRKKARRVGKKKRTHKAEQIVARAVKKFPKLGMQLSPDGGDLGRAADWRLKPAQETSIVLNGWRITLGHNSVKIEQS